MRALIAMSGGVDSSTAAFLLQQEGCDCEGVNLTLYRNTDIGLACHKSCCTQRDAEDAADAAFRLGMPFEELDCRGLFRETVMADFVRSYEAGRTPNPCIECNRKLKFEHLYEKMKDEYYAMTSAPTWEEMLDHAHQLTTYEQEDFGCLNGIQVPFFGAYSKNVKDVVFITENHTLPWYYLYLAD